MERAKDSQAPMRRRTAIGISAVLWLVATFAVVLFWYDSQNQTAEQADRLINNSTEQSALRVEDFVRARIYALDALATAYEIDGEEIRESEFRRSAEAIHRSFDGILAVNWVAPDSTIIWTIPVAENHAAKGRKLVEHETAAPYYLRARDTGAAQLTHPIELFQGNTGVATYFPVEQNGVHVGTVNGVFRVDQLVEASLRGGVFDNYAVRVSDGGREFFCDEDFDEFASRRVARRTFEVLGHEWDFEMAPRDNLWETIHPPHDSMLLIGLICALLLALIAFLALERQRQRYESLRVMQAAERHAQKIEKFDALGRLARGITHDFNNLLTAVGTSAELIELDEELSEEGQTNVDAIREASARARDLTRQLMLFGNPDATVELLPTRLSEYSDKWQQFLSKVVGSRTTFEFERAPDNVVTMDESSILRVLTNLVVNASDAIDGRGTVEVSWRTGEEHVLMQVRDDGAGMSLEVRSRVFEPYFTTKGEQGTGLGLPTVFAMVQAVGGRVELDSELGVGTTFLVLLPLSKD